MNVTRIYKILIIKVAGLNMLKAKYHRPLQLTSPSIKTQNNTYLGRHGASYAWATYLLLIK